MMRINRTLTSLHVTPVSELMTSKIPQLQSKVNQAMRKHMTSKIPRQQSKVTQTMSDPMTSKIPRQSKMTQAMSEPMSSKIPQQQSKVAQAMSEPMTSKIPQQQSKMAQAMRELMPSQIPEQQSKVTQTMSESITSKIPQLQSKATQASAEVANHTNSYYKLLMEQNKHYIQEPPTIEKCQSLAKQLFYTRLASIPHRYNSLWKELDYVKNMVKNMKDLNMENVGIAALFGLECYVWYCGGEIVGRGFTFTGYYV